MNFKKKYNDLKNSILFRQDYNIVIVDFGLYAWASDVKDIDFIFYIDLRLSWKYKLFALAHEIGHYFYLTYSIATLKEAYKLSKKIANESDANKRALIILKYFIGDMNDLKKQYKEFYENISKKVLLTLIKKGKVNII